MAYFGGSSLLPGPGIPLAVMFSIAFGSLDNCERVWACLEVPQTMWNDYSCLLATTVRAARADSGFNMAFQR
jgi:hypothetical protein